MALLVVVLVLVLVAAAAGTAYRLGWADDRLDGWMDDWLDRTPAASQQSGQSGQSGDPWDSPVPSPAAVATPAGDGTTADPAKVRAALAGPLADADLGPHVRAEVAPVSGGAPLFATAPGPAVPASTTKLLTAVAALEVLDPETRFTTKVLRTAPHRIVLVGGGDPLLGSAPAKGVSPARADLRTLASATATALRAAGVTRVRLAFDDSLFSGPTTSPHWPANYVPDDVVSPITALWADQGNDAAGRREADPSAAAAAVFAGHLRAQGLTVRGAPRRAAAGTGTSADAATGTALAQVVSAPLREIVEHTLQTSDNDAAEVLAHHVGAETGAGGSFAGGVSGTVAVLGRLGVPTTGLQLYDGSGLSRDDRIAPATLTGVLRLAATDDRFGSVLSGLPVAGFTGSLLERFEDAASAPGLGVVRAKTGTLTGVHALAGTVTDLDGDALTLVLMADRVTPARTLAARQALDDAAAALAACHCAARPEPAPSATPAPTPGVTQPSVG